MSSILTNATSGQLEQAVARNHAALFYLNAFARGGEVRTAGELTYTYDGTDHQSMIAFPSLHEDAADRQLDEMMAWYGEHPTRGLGCWSLDPPRPADLGIKLKARGFQDGWRPCWMALDLQQAGLGNNPEGKDRGDERDKGKDRRHGKDKGYRAPARLQIVADNHLSLYHLKDLPYVGDHGAVSPLLMKEHPEQVQQFIALVDGKIVGHSAVFFSVGEYGVAGLYNVAVLPSMRQQGIGKALVLAACLYGKDRGYHYAVLNATGRRMYEQIGFQWIGDGFTWWKLP